MPSEFKNNWDLMIKEQISSVFMNFLETPLIYVNLIQELMKIIEAFTSKQIEEKTLQILSFLNLQDKKDSLYKQFINLFQDYNSQIFSCESSEILSSYKEKVKEILSFNYYSFECNVFEKNDEEKSDDLFYHYNINEEIQQLFENPDLQKLVQVYYSLSIYMHLNDPPLKTHLEEFLTRKFFYVNFKKNEYYCIDGFVKDKAPSIIVIPAVMRANFIYNGIKPAVLILGKDILKKQSFQKILQKLQIDCEEKNKKVDENFEKSKIEAENNEKLIKDNSFLEKNFENNHENIEKKENKEDKTNIINSDCEKNTKKEVQESIENLHINNEQKNDLSFEFLLKTNKDAKIDDTLLLSSKKNIIKFENLLEFEQKEKKIEKTLKNFEKNQNKNLPSNFDIFSKKNISTKKSKTLN